MRALAVALCVLSSSCAEHHFADGRVDAGEADAAVAACETSLPAAIVGTYQVIAVDCAWDDDAPPIPPFGLFWTDPCGDAATWLPDGGRSMGRVRRQGDRFVYRPADSSPIGGESYAFRFRPLAEERNGGPILHMEPLEGVTPRWEAWAVRNDGTVCE